ncbi:synaptic vesicle transporter [Rhexocercosporidium sp. MPI-PUGE-AT-0058]|nr:synaptic vesicle transporter [Rhexocercosporidium sp. MPI-PUGE-AT-0058]
MALQNPATPAPLTASAFSTPRTSAFALEQTISTEQRIPAPHCSLPTWRKYLVLATVSWMALVATYSTTSLLPATPEIGTEFHTSVSTLNITNAGFLLAMGFSSFVTGPLIEIFGRRKAYNAALVIFLGCSIGTALAPNLGVFVSMRTLSAFEGTLFMVVGQTILADIFEPTLRGRAVGCFLAATVSGPAIGPIFGGVIVTYTTWRAIYWVQVGMIAAGLIASVLFVPDIRQTSKHHSRIDEKPRPLSKEELRSLFNPLRLLRPLIYPNIILADIACGLLSTLQYGLLSSIREIINPRFHLTTPLISGLFYIAPGAGFLLGSIVGGQFSDRTVRNYMMKRKGVRLPQDRLNSGLLVMLLVVPSVCLIFGWTLRQKVGGMVIPVIMSFVAGAGLMGSFNGLNTYTAEVLPYKRSEVISGKYVIQYMFGAGSTATIVPSINAIGVGWAFTILALLVMLAGLIVLLIARRGLEMQIWVEKSLGKEEDR